MDRSTLAWQAFSLAMRWNLCRAALVGSLQLVASAAAAQDGREALDLAQATLRAHPDQREAARRLLERAAASNDRSETVAEALFRLGEMDETDGAFAQALAHDRACVASQPNSRWAVQASARIDWMVARSEGNFVPLAHLERVRRNPALSNDPAAIDALAKDADQFPPGTVRVEARMLVAEAWLGREGRPRDAIAELRRVTEDSSADPITARLAEHELVQALADGGDAAGAAAEARARAGLLDPRFVRRIQRLVLRRWAERGAVGLVIVFFALAATAIAGAWRRGALSDAARALRSIAPMAVAFALFVGVGGGGLASNYESGNARPFVLLGGVVLPIVLVARAWGAVGSPRPGVRVARAALCGATMLAAAFALLDVVSPEYLEGFGL